MRAIRLALFAILAPCLLASAPPITRELRTHFQVVNPRGEVSSTVSEILQLDESQDRSLYLVTDGDDRLIIEVTHSYWQQRNIKEIRDLRSKAFIRQEYDYPYKSKTRSSTIAEARSSAAKMRFDPLVTVSANGYTRAAHESEWKVEANARVWRSDLRKAVDPLLLDRVERMRGLLFSTHPGLRAVCDQLAARFLYGNACDKNGAAQMVEVTPDCFYDAEFGFTCSATQKAHADDARRLGSVPAFY